MEAIQNYLESMFARLPNTPEVWKAKEELLQMMEDRYNDLIEGGKTSNEAVGAVIAEFGNLDEVAETLGIESVVRREPVGNLPEFSLEDAHEMIADRSRISFLRGLAVLLFIICPVGFIVSESFFRNVGSQVFGLLFLFLCITAGIGLLVFSGVMENRWKGVRSNAYCIDYSTASEIYEEKEEYRVTHALQKAIGIVLIVFSFVPSAVIDEFHLPEYIEDGIGGSLLMIMIGLGVMLLIYTSGKNKAFNEILALNDRSTIAGSHVPESGGEVVYTNERVATVMSVYWHSVTCLYLIWSFLTFDWWITWVIWPVAAVVRNLINSIFAEEERR